MNGEFLLLAGGLLVIIIGVVATVVSTVVTTVATVTEEEDEEEDDDEDEEEDNEVILARKRDRQDCSMAALYLSLAFLLCSAAFEPDFGSWIRHEGITLPVLLLIL